MDRSRDNSINHLLVILTLNKALKPLKRWLPHKSRQSIARIIHHLHKRANREGKRKLAIKRCPNGLGDTLKGKETLIYKCSTAIHMST